jgi:hypothetical protein
VGSRVRTAVKAGRRSLKSPRMRGAIEAGLGTVINSALPAQTRRELNQVARASMHAPARHGRESASTADARHGSPRPVRPRNRTGSRARGRGR